VSRKSNSIIDPAAVNSVVGVGPSTRPNGSSTLLLDIEKNPAKLAALDNLAPQAPAAPLSMQQDSVVTELAKTDLHGAQHYRALIESGWEQVVNPGSVFFVADEQALEEARQRPAHAARKKRIYEKYIDKTGLQKERAVRLDAQGYMCPFVGTTGAGTSAVLGATTSSYVSVASTPGARQVNRGGRMLGLKQRGFGGGNSHAPNTKKLSGRSSWKLDKWAR
jgi:hypothetical protein